MESNNNNDELIKYNYRWLILVLFCLLEMSNAMMWVTFAPISDITQNYFDNNNTYNTTTAVNMFANIFLILYGPGTILSIYMMKTFDLRNSLLLNSLLTVIGTLIRYIAVITSSSADTATTYWLIFLGQSLGAISQPMFLNSPPAIAAIWFPVSERDLATTIGSMCSPIGNAIGQLIPVFLVTQHSKNKDDDDNYTVTGMADLMLVEFILCAVPLAVSFVYLKDKPPTAPSQSTKLKLEKRTASGKIISNGSHEDAIFSESALSAFWSEFKTLLSNRDYILLFVAFSIGVGFFNSLLTLLNQIVAPFGYSNDDAGTFAAVFILFGLVGAGCIGTVMEKTRAYRTILKVGISVCLVVSVLFFVMLFSNNFWPLTVTFAILGFCILPLLPVCMENCAECTYPIGEEVSMGIMFVGSNILGLGFVFAIQYLLEEPPLGPPPFLPSNLFMFAAITIGFIVLLFYQGEYKRLKNESLRDRLLSGANTDAARNIGDFGALVDSGNSDDDDKYSLKDSGGEKSGFKEVPMDDEESQDPSKPLLLDDSQIQQNKKGSGLFSSFFSGQSNSNCITPDSTKQRAPSSLSKQQISNIDTADELVRVTSEEDSSNELSSNMNSSIHYWHNSNNLRSSQSATTSTQSDATLLRPSVGGTYNTQNRDTVTRETVSISPSAVLANNINSNNN